MAFEADKVVVELIAKVDQFDQPVKQSASKFDASMNQISASAAKAEATVTRSSSSRASALQRESGQISQFAKTLAQDMDFAGAHLTSATSPFVVPVKQAPAVTAAIRGVGVAAGALGGILSTVAGVGVALMVAALVEMITKSRGAKNELDDLVQKLKDHYEKTQLSAQAQDIFSHSIEGSIELSRKLTDELSKQNLTLEDNINLKKAALAGNIADLVGNIGGVSTRLAAAIQQMREAQHVADLAESGRLGGENPAAALIAAQTRLQAARQQVADLTAQLISLNGAAENSARALRTVDFPLIERDAKAAANPLAAINLRFDKMADSAKKAGTYTRQLATDIERQRAAAIKAQQDLNKAAPGSGLFGRQISFADAASIARRAGLTVTSAQRSTADQARLYNDPSVNRPGNPVARPGTSAHEGVSGKWALDIAFAPGLTAEKLKKIYGDEGTSLSAVFKEKGHFHIEGNRSQAAAGERAANREAAALAREEGRQHDKLLDAMSKEVDVSIDKVNLLDEYNRGLSIAETLAGQNVEALKDWDKQFEQISDSMQEFNDFASRELDELFNPDNWKNWGDFGKRVLRDLQMEILRLGAANPLKNLLLGQNNPTLGSLFSGLFGGGSGGIGAPNIGAPALVTLSTSSLIPRAGGGPVSAGGGYWVGEHGPEPFFPTQNGFIMPSNARAAAPGGGMGSVVRVLIEASKYFDGRVMEVTGPVIARTAVASANGGATIARQNLGREAMHRLE